MNRLIVIADIVASRDIADRAAVQRDLKAALDGLNRQTDGLLSPYTITLGDEFQAVLSTAGRVFTDMLAIRAAVYPVRLRFAVSIGTLATPINPNQAIGMDGPAFHAARESIEQLKQGDHQLALAGEIPGQPQDLMHSTLNLLDRHWQSWLANRLVILHRLLQGDTVATLAKSLKISEQAVYKNIRQGGLDDVTESIQTLTRYLDAALAE